MEEITLELALKTAEMIVAYAKKDGGEPIAVTIVGVNPNFPIVTLAMDGVMPKSPKLSWQKGYTSVMTIQDTIYWAKWQEKGKDIGNFCDQDITGFAGGVLIKDPKSGKIIGAIGVSGRKGYQQTVELKLKQDHELAQLGAIYLEEILELQKIETVH